MAVQVAPGKILTMRTLGGKSTMFDRDPDGNNLHANSYTDENSEMFYKNNKMCQKMIENLTLRNNSTTNVIERKWMINHDNMFRYASNCKDESQDECNNYVTIAKKLCVIISRNVTGDNNNNDDGNVTVAVNLKMGKNNKNCKKNCNVHNNNKNVNVTFTELAKIVARNCQTSEKKHGSGRKDTVYDDDDYVRDFHLYDDRCNNNNDNYNNDVDMDIEIDEDDPTTPLSCSKTYKKGDNHNQNDGLGSCEDEKQINENRFGLRNKDRGKGKDNHNNKNKWRSKNKSKSKGKSKNKNKTKSTNARILNSLKTLRIATNNINNNNNKSNNTDDSNDDDYEEEESRTITHTNNTLKLARLNNYTSKLNFSNLPTLTRLSKSNVTNDEMIAMDIHTMSNLQQNSNDDTVQTIDTNNIHDQQQLQMRKCNNNNRKETSMVSDTDPRAITAQQLVKENCAYYVTIDFGTHFGTVRLCLPLSPETSLVGGRLDPNANTNNCGLARMTDSRGSSEYYDTINENGNYKKNNDNDYNDNDCNTNNNNYNKNQTNTNKNTSINTATGSYNSLHQYTNTNTTTSATMGNNDRMRQQLSLDDIENSPSNNIYGDIHFGLCKPPESQARGKNGNIFRNAFRNLNANRNANTNLNSNRNGNIVTNDLSDDIYNIRETYTSEKDDNDDIGEADEKMKTIDAIGNSNRENDILL